MGGTVFDRTFGNAFGTDGSFLGGDFILEAAVGPWDLKVTYVDLVDSLADGPGAVRDIWGQLDIDFIGGATAPAYFTVDNRLFFHQDTDIVGARMPCPPGYTTTAEGACVPEPSTLVYGLVLLGVAMSRFLHRRLRAR
jgi:hypothetical protein